MIEITEFIKTFEFEKDGEVVTRVASYLKVVWECDADGCDNCSTSEVPLGMGGIKPTPGPELYLCVSCWFDSLLCDEVNSDPEVDGCTTT